jgi:hypothetical protein
MKMSSADGHQFQAHPGLLLRRGLTRHSKLVVFSDLIPTGNPLGVSTSHRLGNLAELSVGVVVSLIEIKYSSVLLTHVPR